MAIIGAVAGTVGTINILKTWVEELLRFLEHYKDVGQTLQSLDLSLVVHETSLRLWMKFWNLEQPTSRRFQRELWGKETLPAIEHIFVAIRSALEKTKAELTELLKDYFRLPSENDTQLGLTSTIDFREAAIGAKKQLELSPKIAVFIRKNGPSLKARLQQVGERIVTLSDTSTKAFETRHRKGVGGALTEEQLAEAGTSVLMQMAIETRYASMGLYQSYREKIKSDTIILDVDLIDDRATQLESVRFRNSAILKYRFAVPWPSKPQRPLEIVIEGPFDLEKQVEKSPMPLDRGFAEACYAALMNATAEFKIYCRAEVYSFRSRVPLDTIIASSANDLKPLADLLYKLDTMIKEEPGLYFPRSQRVRLAYKLIQCGLLISGTSWLSQLENGILKRTPKCQNGDYHFLLELSCDAEVSNEKTFAAISQHLFAVGVLLVELGLGQPMKSITWDDGGELPVFTTVTAGNDSLTSKQWQSRLIAYMGDDYTKATKYCLAQKTGGFWDTVNQPNTEPDVRERAYLGVLQEYYIKAYLPYVSNCTVLCCPQLTAWPAC